MNFDPRTYWEERLREHPDLEGVGCEGRSQLWNEFLYKSKVRAMNRALDKLGVNLRGCKALDIGTGIGFWIDYLLEKGADSIMGIDIAPSSIEFCKRRYSNMKNIGIIYGDISDDAFMSEKSWGGYDSITAFDVLYHIVDDRKFCVAIKNIANALKPGGYLFLSDTLFSSGDRISPGQHVRLRSLNKYREELNRNELDIVYLAPALALLGSPIDASGLFGRTLYLLYYKITFRLTSKSKAFPSMERAYLSVLYYLDSLLTSYPRFGVSSKLLVARKRD